MSNNTLIIILELTMALESTAGLEFIIHTVHFSLGLTPVLVTTSTRSLAFRIWPTVTLLFSGTTD